MDNQGWRQTYLLRNRLVVSSRGRAAVGCYLGQVRIHKPVIQEDANHCANQWGKDRDQPVGCGEEALCSNERSKQARPKVTGRVDGIATGAAKAQTNSQNRAADQEWSQIVHQAGILGIATAPECPTAGLRCRRFLR